MKIKFLADENLRRAIVLGLRRREPGVTFLQAFEVGAVAQNDLTVLKIAAGEDCILVSHDVRTMPHYYREFIQRERSPGLILVPQRLALRAAIEDLALLWTVSEHDELTNQICFLPI